MKTDALIDRLASGTVPVRRNAAALRILAAAVAGSIVALAMIVGLLGLRHDWNMATMEPVFWVKLLYTGGVALIALASAAVLARPEASPPRTLWMLLLPFGIVAMLAAAELIATPREHWMPLITGSRSRYCSPDILLFSLPVFAALVLAFRTLAPTRLRWTGATLGLAAGALAGVIYCLHCPEDGMTFITVWYSVGMLLPALLGALIGPLVLRW
jgi:hypothetical protein